MKVVIFCGGQGTRLREETEYKPKPMVSIGNLPILCHIMKIYNHFGYRDFILTLGYKGDMIKEYFIQFMWRNSDFTLNTKSKIVDYHHNINNLDDWNITFAETGKDSLTARRLFRVKKYLENEENFMLTYGDGIANVDIDKLIEFHKQKGKVVTLTGINPKSPYGVIDIDNEGIATSFKEKPGSNDLINGGFMVINKRIFNYIINDDNYMFEDLLLKLAQEGEVSIYHHKDFWHCMDTYRDYLKLNNLWKEGKTPWKIES